MTNPVIDTLMAHKSDRSFTDEALSASDIDAILKAGWRAPTSKNAQHVSVVVIQNPDTRARTAACAGGQPWIAKAPVFFCLLIDTLKTTRAAALHGQPHTTPQTLEGLLAASTDAGIALGNMMAAAHSLGLGCVPIGGIRANPDEMVALLQLPPLTFPLVGLAVGHIKNPAPLKPRMDMATFAHAETYSDTGLDHAIPAYDATLLAHWAATSRGDGKSWSKSMAETGKGPSRPHLLACLRKQGFDAA